MTQRGRRVLAGQTMVGAKVKQIDRAEAMEDSEEAMEDREEAVL